MNSVLLSTLIKYKEIFSEFTGREHLLTSAHPLIIQPSQLFSNARGSHFPLFYNLFHDPWWCKFGGFSIDSPVLFYNMSSVSLFPCPSLMMWNQRKRMCFSIVKCKRDPMNQGQFNMTELQLRCRSFSWWNSCWVHAAWPPFVSVEPRGKKAPLFPQPLPTLWEMCSSLLENWAVFLKVFFRLSQRHSPAFWLLLVIITFLLPHFMHRPKATHSTVEHTVYNFDFFYPKTPSPCAAGVRHCTILLASKAIFIYRFIYLEQPHQLME